VGFYTSTFSFRMHRYLLIYIRTLVFIRALSALKNIYGCLEVVLIHLDAVIVVPFFITSRNMEMDPWQKYSPIPYDL
jgi:hypothetical protein